MRTRRGREEGEEAEELYRVTLPVPLSFPELKRRRQAREKGPGKLNDICSNCLPPPGSRSLWATLLLKITVFLRCNIFLSDPPVPELIRYGPCLLPLPQEPT